MIQSARTNVPQNIGERNKDFIFCLQGYAGFYPVNPNKAPACKGQLEKHLTTNSSRIREWQRKHAGIGARIKDAARLFVVDVEDPNKHPGRFGPDGTLSFGEQLLEHNIALPTCPTVMTGSGGFHYYFLAPKGMKVESQIGIWPGVDILAGGSNVIMPGSRTSAGPYTTLRGVDECSIPEAPRAFVRLLQSAGNGEKQPAEKLKAETDLPESTSDGQVSRRKWFLLHRNRIFRTMWNRTKLHGDQSDSAYEYHIAKACYCVGLDSNQTITVLRTWWKLHGIKAREKKLRKAILPGAWAAVAEIVQAWKAQHEGTLPNSNTTSLEGVVAPKPKHRALSASTRAVLEVKADNPSWTPAEIAKAAGVSRRHAALVLSRHAPHSNTGEVCPPPGEVKEPELPRADSSATISTAQADSLLQEVVLHYSCVPPAARASWLAAAYAAFRLPGASGVRSPIPLRPAPSERGAGRVPDVWSSTYGLVRVPA